MRTIAEFAGDYQIRAFDTPAYIQERALIKAIVTNNYAQGGARIYVAFGTLEAYYEMSATTWGGASAMKCTIDVSDILRMNGRKSGTLTVGIYDIDRETVSASWQVPWEFGGYIKTVQEAIPASHATAMLTIEGEASLDTDHTSVCPSVVIQPFDSIVFVFRLSKMVDYTQAKYTAWASPTANTNGHALISHSTKAYNEIISEDTSNSGNRVIVQTIYPRQRVCEKSYACVEWIARDGSVKRATWEFLKVAHKSTGKVDLSVLSDGYRQLKGQEMELTLHLDGLTPYDAWWYGDIATSPDVRVKIGAPSTPEDFSVEDIDDDETYDVYNDMLLSENYGVVVEDDEQGVLDGINGFDGQLNVRIKYRNYDTI